MENITVIKADAFCMIKFLKADVKWFKALQASIAFYSSKIHWLADISYQGGFL